MKKAVKGAPPQVRSLVVHPRKVARAFYRLTTALGLNGPNPRSFTPCSMDLPPRGSDHELFAIEYLAAEVFSKFDDESSSEKKAAAAWERFHAAEEACHQTNLRIKHDLSSKDFFKSDDVRSVLYTAQRKIQGVLGPFDWNEASRYFGFGPGASTRLSRRNAHPVYKYSGRPETTIGNACLSHAAIMQKAPLWQEGLEFREGVGYCEIVPGNRVVTVPKNYKMDRVIAIEPCMNMYIQKGLGGVMRSRLRSVGVDLNDQSKNQRLARVGSLSGLLATIDLSMASDTVSTELVRYLLPPDWLLALEQCRSLSGSLPSGERVVFQKFSSMGNGFTFELESLIFWALAQTCIEASGTKDRRIAIYGDDIIVPKAAVPLLVDILTYCGFTCNAKKTHVDGPFRESCGKHYLNGNDVSPFYIRRDVKSLRDLFLLHNNIYRWSGRVNLCLDDLAKVRSCLLELRGLAPKSWRKPRIPDGIGDGAFIGTFDECTPKLAFKFRKLGYEGYSVEVLADVSQLTEVDSTGRLVWSLCNVTNRRNSARVLGGRLISLPEDTVSVGGVSLPPRVREVMTLVPLFPRDDHLSRVSG